MILDGSGSDGRYGSVAIEGGQIADIGTCTGFEAGQTLNAAGHVLAPGFIDVHTHDDLAVIRDPAMLPKLSQGVTTVIVGNCGISAAPVTRIGDFPDPMILLGEPDEFRYPTFASYVAAVNGARPSVNVAALAGHTVLRNNHLDRLDRTAASTEVEQMRTQLREALDAGALGLSTGLAYRSAYAASTEEVLGVAQPLRDRNAIYATHMRSETGPILEAMEEAFRVGRELNVRVIISHLKCAGIDNWGRSQEVLAYFDGAFRTQAAGCDCYPYAAGSSTLDLGQVDERVRIAITWSKPFAEMAGKTLSQIAALWRMSHLEAARRLQPAGAVYHSISEDDMRAILRHPQSMIGSDGLPHDPLPHPRLWGTFPRVLGRYSRELKLFPLSEAVRKMTSLPASRFGLTERGRIEKGFRADLVLFDPETILDTATFEKPAQAAQGIRAVWVDGVLSFREGQATGERAGCFVARGGK